MTIQDIIIVIGLSIGSLEDTVKVDMTGNGLPETVVTHLVKPSNILYPTSDDSSYCKIYGDKSFKAKGDILLLDRRFMMPREGVFYLYIGNFDSVPETKEIGIAKPIDEMFNYFRWNSDHKRFEDCSD